MDAANIQSTEQLRQRLLEDIQQLPAELLQEVSESISRLSLKVSDAENEQSSEEIAYPYESLKESGLLGCFEGPSDLSVNYKQYLAEGLKEKYGHH